MLGNWRVLCKVKSWSEGDKMLNEMGVDGGIVVVIDGLSSNKLVKRTVGGFLWWVDAPLIKWGVFHDA